MKTIYYMAVCKPKASKTWLPMVVNNGIHILRQTAQVCERDAAEYMTDEYIAACAPNNKFSRASQWEVAAAAVVIA